MAFRVRLVFIEWFLNSTFVITLEDYKQFSKYQNIISVVFLFVRKIINLTSYSYICAWHVTGAKGENNPAYT